MLYISYTAGRYLARFMVTPDSFWDGRNRF